MTLLLIIIGVTFAIFRCGVEHGRMLEREPLHEPRLTRLLDESTQEGQ